MVEFTASTGITGAAFSEKRIIYKNGESLEHSFEDIDNAVSYAYVKSYMFIPLFNIKGERVGVFQLYNKKNGDINETDMQGFCSIQKLLGLLIEHTMELNNALNFVVSAKSTTAKLIEHTSKDDNSEDLVVYYIKVDKLLY